jgi:hypothetical protein
MIGAAETDLSRIFNPSNRDTSISECLQLATAWLPAEVARGMRAAWETTCRLYSGSFPGYHACNTEYHDFAHTCDVLGATVRMCDGALTRGVGLDHGLLFDACVASMLHDVGYIQERGDMAGTGAKYTKTHVARSMAFAQRHAADFGLNAAQASRVARLIAGTDLATPFDSIAFESPAERYAGMLVASADLLGQMADRTYLEKLLFLYYEFQEAGYPGYDTEFDILRKTLGFYEMTKTRLYGLLGEVIDLPRYHFAARYGADRNLYIESIERQIEYLATIIEDDTVNFRKKLKRLDLEAVSAARRGR